VSPDRGRKRCRCLQQLVLNINKLLGAKCHYYYTRQLNRAPPIWGMHGLRSPKSCSCGNLPQFGGHEALASARKRGNAKAVSAAERQIRVPLLIARPFPV